MQKFGEVSNEVDLQAKAVTDDEYEEAIRVVPGNLSRKRGISPESDSEAESGKSQSQQSRKKKTVKFAETEWSGSQMGECKKASFLNIRRADSLGADKSEPAPSPIPKPLGVTNGHEPVNSPEPSVQDPKIFEQTRRIAALETKLATVERQVEEYKRAKDSADKRWSSQHGQLRAAERDARKLRRANPKVAHYMSARNEAEHKMKSQGGELRKAKERIGELERKLRAEKDRTAKLEASLAKARVDARDETTMEVGRDLAASSTVLTANV